MSSECCHTTESLKENTRPDFVFYGSLFVILGSFVLYPLVPQIDGLYDFSYAVADLLRTMWWGIALGILFVGLMSKVPREYFSAVLGAPGTWNGIFRATIAGLFLDLCSHGILMIGAKLYERGAGLGQIMAFLIASPWNSLSMTFILISLIGLNWTLLYIAGSLLIAVLTGFIFQLLVKRGVLPDNPHRVDPVANFSIREDARNRLSKFKMSKEFVYDVFVGGFKEARMLLRWLLLGIVIAACIRSFVPPDLFADWFGPSVLGLFTTLLATTIIEVCSEGSAPVASEIVHSAGAPGNGFTFLMAGVSTDYTEIAIVKEFSKSWKTALFIPLVTIPQILLLGYLMNGMS